MMAWFGEAPRANGVRRGYAICTTPRTGSNFLCQLLTSTGVLGRPLEYFNGDARRSLEAPTYPDAPRQQIAWILDAGSTPNGVYGLKVFPHQHDRIARDVRWTSALPGCRFVVLSRRDILGQAISLSRARQTARYRSTQSVKGEARYNGFEILATMSELAREQARWEMFFARTGLPAERLIYEVLVEEPEREVGRIARLMEVEAARIDPRLVDLSIQRDTTSDAWRQRFIADHGNPDVIDKL